MKSEMVTRFAFALASASIHTTALQLLFALRKNLRLLSDLWNFFTRSYFKGKKSPHNLQKLSNAFLNTEITRHAFTNVFYEH